MLTQWFKIFFYLLFYSFLTSFALSAFCVLLSASKNMTKFINTWSKKRAWKTFRGLVCKQSEGCDGLEMTSIFSNSSSSLMSGWGCITCMTKILKQNTLTKSLNQIQRFWVLLLGPFFSAQIMRLVSGSWGEKFGQGQN